MINKKIKYNKIKSLLRPNNNIWHIENLDSPTHYNIAQKLIEHNYFPTKNQKKAKFTDANMQLNEIEAQLFEYKHQLKELSDFMHFDFMPETYNLNIRNYDEVLSNIKNKKNKKWILKPSMTNNGDDIHLFNSLDLAKKHLKNSNLQGPQVLQDYIQNPSLINNRKYTFRFFVILNNYHKISENKYKHRYKHGYYNLCVNKYDPKAEFNDNNIRSHLTNEHLQILNQNITKNITQIATTQFPDQKLLNNIIINQVDKIIDKTIEGMLNVNPNFLKNNNINKFDIFGYDFLLDKDNKLWLLEINHRPCFPIDKNHELWNSLYNNFWEDIYKKYVFSIINK
jgi:hypothetical protein